MIQHPGSNERSFILSNKHYFHDSFAIVPLIYKGNRRRYVIIAGMPNPNKNHAYYKSYEEYPKYPSIAHVHLDSSTIYPTIRVVSEHMTHSLGILRSRIFIHRVSKQDYLFSFKKQHIPIHIANLSFELLFPTVHSTRTLLHCFCFAQIRVWMSEESA